MKTYYQTNEDALANRKWVLINAENQIVGRIATKIASILRGKHNPGHSLHNDDGDFVVVINAEKMKFSGNKAEQKVYYTHSGYTAGLRADVAGELLQKKPEEIIKRAVKGMLPKTTLGRQQLTKLKVYVGAEHPHQAQQPTEISL